MTKFQKQKLILRQHLIGARYYEALAAMQFAERHHDGMRKDGVTPEFAHQCSIALYALTLPDLIDMEGTIATIMLHDTKEDKGISDGEILAIFRDREFGQRVVTSTDRMTKKWRGETRNEDVLFGLMSDDPRASIAKGADRMHNIQTMVSVFSSDKQQSYIDFARARVLPMLKKARRNFPHQTRAYENIKFVLNSQIELIEAALKAQLSSDK